MKEVFANISFKPEKEGGRSQPLPSGTFGCPVFFDGVPGLLGHGYDCRFVFSKLKTVYPGELVENIQMHFLSPEDVVPLLSEGINFSLWEGKTIAHGRIIRLADI